MYAVAARWMCMVSRRSFDLAELLAVYHMPVIIVGGIGSRECTRTPGLSVVGGTSSGCAVMALEATDSLRLDNARKTLCSDSN